MYKICLRPINNNPFKNQTIFWYPLQTTQFGNFVSFNIATGKNFKHLEKLSNKGYILAEYFLNPENICFIYHGNKIDNLVDNFGEKAFITNNGKISYFFTESELRSIYEKNVGLNYSNDITFKDIQYFTNHELSKKFREDWEFEFSLLNKTCKYSSDLFLPHPIIQLIDCTSKKLGEIYYREMLIYLLNRSFLVSWINIDDISSNLRSDILNKYNELAKTSKKEHDLPTIIKNITVDLFNRSDIFRIVYLAAQCGSSNSVLKAMMNNLYSLLPFENKEYIDSGYINFQPKVTVESIELHFIQSTSFEWELIKIYEALLEISKNVKFYDIVEHKILEDEELIRKSFKTHKISNRYRFICDISIFPVIDYSKLNLKVSELSDAIVAILNKCATSGIHRISIKELWIKRIGLIIFTPPQFEEDVMYSLSQKWIINHFHLKDCTYEKNGVKTMNVDLYCDYPVFTNEEFSFSFSYSCDIQYMYSILNETLKNKHNFSQFSSNLSNNYIDF